MNVIGKVNMLGQLVDNNRVRNSEGITEMHITDKFASNQEFVSGVLEQGQGRYSEFFQEDRGT